MATNLPQYPQTQLTNISLWGPTGAGKDWLIRSFARELQYYNHQNDGFHYQLGTLTPGQTEPTPLIGEAPIQIEPTTMHEDLEYRFDRLAHPPDRTRAISEAHHQIIIHNDKGQGLVDGLYEPAFIENALQSVLESANIFLVLGPPRESLAASTPQPAVERSGPMSDWDRAVSENDLPRLSSSERGNDLSRQDYFNIVAQLLARLGNAPRRNLAICMTKSDLLNERGDAGRIFRSRYGFDLSRSLEVSSRYHNIRAFLTSAAGYLRQPGGKLASNTQAGELRDVLRWDPINTAAPFFWIFEQIDRSRLSPRRNPFSQDPVKAYISYPPPRPF